MREYAYRIVNVFTRNGRLTGNPLCVFEDGEGLDGAAMQDLARQFNLSETTFILPSTKATAHVRIFTPSYEMPFAGHPTLGSAHVVRALKGGDAVALEMKAGVIPVNAKGDRWTQPRRVTACRHDPWRLSPYRCRKGLDPQVDEIGRPGELEREEGRFRGLQQRGETGACGHGPTRLTRRHANRRKDTGTPAAQQGVPDRECRVLAGRDDHDDRHREEGGELRQHEGILSAEARATRPRRPRY